MYEFFRIFLWVTICEKTSYVVYRLSYDLRIFIFIIDDKKRMTIVKNYIIWYRFTNYEFICVFDIFFPRCLCVVIKCSIDYKLWIYICVRYFFLRWVCDYWFKRWIMLESLKSIFKKVVTIMMLGALDEIKWFFLWPMTKVVTVVILGALDKMNWFFL